MRKLIVIFITSIIASQVLYILDANAEENKMKHDFLHVNSLRNNFEDIVVIPSNDPLFGLIGSYYDFCF